MIDDFLKNKINPINNEKSKINILLEINNKLQVLEPLIERKINPKNYISNVKDDLESFKKLLNRNKIKSDFIEKIYEKTLMINENQNRIKNQKSIYDFYINLYNNRLKKIKNNLIKKSEYLFEMKNFNIDTKENLHNKYINDLKKLKFGNINILEYIERKNLFTMELIDPKFREFLKSLEMFEKKIKNLDNSFKIIEDEINNKINQSKISTLSYDLEDFIKTQFEYFVNEFKKITIDENSNINKSNNECLYDYGNKNLFKDLLARFENFWKNLKENNINEELLNVNSIKVKNF